MNGWSRSATILSATIAPSGRRNRPLKSTEKTVSGSSAEKGRPGPEGPRATIPREGVRGFASRVSLPKDQAGERVDRGACGLVVEPIPVRAARSGLLRDVV